MHFRIPIGL